MRSLHKEHKSERLIGKSCLSLSLPPSLSVSACFISESTERISIKFDIEVNCIKMYRVKLCLVCVFPL
jgi:hypothetical protein